MPRTLFDKIWDAHLVRDLADGSSLVHVDRLFLHERTGSIALLSLADAGRRVRNPRHVFATMDHIVDTFPGRGDATLVPGGEAYIKAMRDAARNADIELFDIDDSRHGISHLIAAEQAIALPGLIVACPDSHTCTLGALGALGWGIGTSDCEHALATETLRAAKPQQMRVVIDGALGSGVTAKDMVLHLIGRYGADGARGHALEFCGDTVSQLSVEGRATLCNMAVEFSAFTGIIAPDDAVYGNLESRPFAPSGERWGSALKYWQTLASESDAVFDAEIAVDAADIAPSISWGTSPQHTVAIDMDVPAVQTAPSDDAAEQMRAAMEYMDVRPGAPLIGLPIDAAFIGSCTNARLSDLRAAAILLRGRKVASGVRAICTPGSAQVKQAAEREGLDVIFTNAGFEWREPGCSLCFHAGGEGFRPGDRVVTSTNRNFRGRQGPGVRSHLASPATVAASAVAGAIADARSMVPK